MLTGPGRVAGVFVNKGTNPSVSASRDITSQYDDRYDAISTAHRE